MALSDRGVLGGPLQPVVLTNPTGVPSGTVSIDQTTPGSTNGVQVVAALPTGTNNIGDVDIVTLPALPTGTNNIGDVDILSIIPGVAATNLGKAEDAAHSSGDVGVMLLAVRKDTAAALGADGDYVPLESDANGAAWVSLATQLDEANDSVTVWGNTAADGSGTPKAILTDAAGHTQVDVLSITAGTNKIGTVDPVTATPTTYNLTLTNANTEYSQAMPANCRGFEFQARTDVEVRYAFVTGKVATPTAPWLDLKIGDYYYSYPLNQGASPSTIFFASATAGVIMDILAWT